MRLKIKFLLPFIILASTLFAQKGIEFGISTGVVIERFKVLDGGNRIFPQVEGSNTLSLLLRKGLSKNFSVETGLTYKYLRDGLHPNTYRHFIVPLKFNGKFEISKKNKIYFVPSAGIYYLTNTIGPDSFSANEFENSFRLSPGQPRVFYSYNSNFNGNTVGVSGEIALEFLLFSKLTFHFGLQYSSVFKDIYVNNLQYFAEGQDVFTATISSQNQYRGYNISFYYPIGGNQKN